MELWQKKVAVPTLAIVVIAILVRFVLEMELDAMISSSICGYVGAIIGATAYHIYKKLI